MQTLQGRDNQESADGKGEQDPRSILKPGIRPAWHAPVLSSMPGTWRHGSIGKLAKPAAEPASLSEASGAGRNGCRHALPLGSQKTENIMRAAPITANSR